MYGNQHIILFIDNLAVHKTKESKAKYVELNITPLYNVAYSPEFNGIEYYWSIVKQHYKKLLLYHLMHDLPLD
jgi:transposase